MYSQQSVLFSIMLALHPRAFKKKWSITPDQYMILEIANEEIPIQKEIVEKLPVSQGTVNKGVAELVQDGFVEKRKPKVNRHCGGGCPEEIIVTEKGLRLMKEIRENLYQQFSIK